MSSHQVDLLGPSEEEEGEEEDEEEGGGEKRSDRRVVGRRRVGRTSGQTEGDGVWNVGKGESG